MLFFFFFSHSLLKRLTRPKCNWSSGIYIFVSRSRKSGRRVIMTIRVTEIVIVLICKARFAYPPIIQRQIALRYSSCAWEFEWPINNSLLFVQSLCQQRISTKRNDEAQESAARVYIAPWYEAIARKKAHAIVIRCFSVLLLSALILLNNKQDL